MEGKKWPGHPGTCSLLHTGHTWLDNQSLFGKSVKKGHMIYVFAINRKARKLHVFAINRVMLILLKTRDCANNSLRANSRPCVYGTFVHKRRWFLEIRVLRNATSKWAYRPSSIAYSLSSIVQLHYGSPLPFAGWTSTRFQPAFLDLEGNAPLLT